MTNDNSSFLYKLMLNVKMVWYYDFKYSERLKEKGNIFNSYKKNFIIFLLKIILLIII